MAEFSGYGLGQGRWAHAGGSSRTVYEPGASMSLFPPKMNVSYDKTSLRGTPDAQITIVEFTDFRCGFCRQAEGTLKEVLAKYPGKVALAHKDYPLAGMDSQSALASEAARCAGAPGKGCFAGSPASKLINFRGIRDDLV